MQYVAQFLLTMMEAAGAAEERICRPGPPLVIREERSPEGQ